MQPQQKPDYLTELNPQATAKPSPIRPRQPIAISLPKLDQPPRKYHKLYFNDYLMGSKMVNQIPLLIFRSANRKTAKIRLLQRYRTQEAILDRIVIMSPSLKNAIHRVQTNSQASTPMGQHKKQAGLQTLSLKSVAAGQKVSSKSEIYAKKPINRTVSLVEAQPRKQRPQPGQQKPLSLCKNMAQDKQSIQFAAIEGLNISKKYIKLRKRQNKQYYRAKCKDNLEAAMKLPVNQEQVGPWVNRIESENNE